MENRRIFLLLLFMVIGYLITLSTITDAVRVPFCPTRSAKDSIFKFQYQTCPESTHHPHFVSVTEGDELWLQIGLDMIHKKKCDYVALLFYASWCPFSRSFRPSFDVISSLYSSIPHFAIKESSVKPSTLSKYGVHGFPTLLLLNSTMRARYQGTRLLDSLVAFYTDVTGIDKTSMEKSVSVPLQQLGSQNKTKLENCPFTWARSPEPENCPFTWAKSPENMLRQETYLTLAIVFVLLRLIHLIYPTLILITRFAWRRIAQNMRLESLLEHTVGFLSRAVQLCMQLKEPCRRSNLQGGAMNARAWASKSLATVSIGDSSSSNRASSSSQ